MLNLLQPDGVNKLADQNTVPIFTYFMCEAISMPVNLVKHCLESGVWSNKSWIQYNDLKGKLEGLYVVMCNIN